MNVEYPFGPILTDADFEKSDTEPLPFRVHVDKATHRIRFENETEDHVTIVVERKERSK